MARSFTKLIEREGRLSPSLAGFLIVFSTVVVRFAISPLSGYDVRDYRAWAEAIAKVGTTAVYGADIYIPANYPPIYYYILDALNHIYSVFSPTFDTSSLLFGVLLKFPAILADAAIALAIYLFLLKRLSPRSALIGSLSYSLNPAVIWNTAYWGGMDAVNSLFALLSVLLLLQGRPAASWSLMVLSLLTKPLSAPVGIVVAFGTVVRFGLKQLTISIVSAVLTALVVVSPFFFAGSLGEMWTALGRNIGNYDNLSANAHNFWWLVSGGYGWTKDTNLFLGLVSYRTIGLALFACFAVLCLVYLRKRRSDSSIFYASAMLTFAFFMLPTEVHENWIFGVFPFLAVAAALEPRCRPIFAVLTVTFWLNMALHDLAFGYDLPQGWLGSLLSVARMGNAVANCLALAYGVFLLGGVEMKPVQKNSSENKGYGVSE